ncbi:MAG: hypothetical protein ING84_05080 [Cytophagales bacterium]|jgi:hypothetical protein|nr:hypothetical protein [Cytophagales bacterium]MCA6365982.1 hypothetical protein [Cytophagales bacterium]MCA6372428.1 hypothetical protein [Cytophagales bacterium]MCA6374858.1 hypothetical protein [Cytophagales bacterium]MCA6382834.1 hypothetical protein [Cytophagales bacterium]
MGLTIHYNGHLRTKVSLPALVEEVKDIAKIHQWPFEIYETEFPLHRFNRKKHSNLLYGICFTPPECEKVSLCFLSNGQLVGFWSWQLFVKTLGKDKGFLEGGASVKTQYAGEVIHKTLIHLLDYLSKKYFRSFTMADEGKYWETRDEKLLQKKFSTLTGLLKTLSGIIETTPINPKEPFEKYFEGILKEVHAQNKLSK